MSRRNPQHPRSSGRRTTITRYNTDNEAERISRGYRHVDPNDVGAHISSSHASSRQRSNTQQNPTRASRDVRYPSQSQHDDSDSHGRHASASSWGDDESTLVDDSQGQHASDISSSEDEATRRQRVRRSIRARRQERRGNAVGDSITYSKDQFERDQDELRQRSFSDAQQAARYLDPRGSSRPRDPTGHWAADQRQQVRRGYGPSVAGNDDHASSYGENHRPRRDTRSRDDTATRHYAYGRERQFGRR